MEVGEVGIAGAEIVERERQPVLAAMRHHRGDGRVVEHAALGDLELERARREPVAFGAGDDLPRHAGLDELARRKVHRDRRQRVGAAVAQRLQHGDDAVEHVLAHRHDQRGFLRELDELGRRHGASPLQRPAHQRLVTGDAARGDVVDRLVAHLERARVERFAQLRLEADLVDAGALGRIVAGHVLGRQRRLGGQGRHQAADPLQQAVDQRAQDRIARLQALQELRALDGEERAVAARGRGGAAGRAVDQAQLADQLAGAEQPVPRGAAALHRDEFDLAAFDQPRAIRRVALPVQDFASEQFPTDRHRVSPGCPDGPTAG